MAAKRREGVSVERKKQGDPGLLQDAGEVLNLLDDAHDELAGAIEYAKELAEDYPRMGWVGVRKTLEKLRKETARLANRVEVMVPWEEGER